jgi:2'-hydroxyisoflavone reductase
VSRAIAAGLTFRPLAVTVSDTLAWDRTRPQNEPMKAGLDDARERELLDRWRSSDSSPRPA